MRICILTPRFPFPENGGDVLRINHIARHLKAQGHRLTLVSFREKNADLRAASQLYDSIHVVRRNRLASLAYSLLYMVTGRPMQCGYYHSMRLWKTFQKVIKEEKPERYIAHLLRMAPYLEKAHLERHSTVEMTDALSRTYLLSAKAQGLSLKKFVYARERALIWKYEMAVIRKFPKVVVVSRIDLDYLKAFAPNASKSLRLHTNGVTTGAESPLAYQSGKICFIGNMRTLQNQDAVIHFVRHVFPVIKRHVPQARFHVVGDEPPHFIRKLAEGDKDIVVTGFVRDLERYVADSHVAVAPVRIASGIQNKMLVAMGCHLPVVSTPLIAAAIPGLADRVNCMIGESDEDFAMKCVALMRDGELRSRVAAEGFRLVKEQYSWNNTLEGY